MIALDQIRTKRLIAIHGWSGTILGLLLYAVVLTGTIAVFADEIAVWSEGGSGSAEGLVELVDRPMRDLARQVDPAYLEEISIFKNTSGAIQMSFHEHRVNPATGDLDDHGVVYQVDPHTGEVLTEARGFQSDLRANERESALERFLVDLHVQLYVPAPWGLLLTGILGLAMMVASVSGFLIHRHLIRDAFLPPRGQARLVSARDRHVLASTWSLPFGFVLAFTGAFFSFAISLGLPIVAMVAFGGDERAMIERIVGFEAPADTSPASLASLDYILADSAARSGSAPAAASIEGYGTASAKVTVFHRPAGGALTGITNVYDGTDRRFIGIKPTLGTEPSVGSTVIGLMAPLHFGDFAGLLSKLAWLGLGGAMSYVVVTGMHMWVRRRGEQRIWQRLGRAITITAWGLPLAMLGSAFAFFLTLPAGDPVWWTPAGFVIAAFAAIAAGLGAEDPSDRYRRALALACLALPLLRQFSGGTAWGDALVDGQMAIIAVDMSLFLLGALLFWRPRVSEPTNTALLEPAE
ncbi:MAG: PepSY-associated TM helix domain-containing protein [Pseudomonadota bacterium]